MKVISSIQEIHEYTAKLKKRGHTIGFAPTMGALHEGHVSLMAAARLANKKVIASIFVNPAQFAPGEDFDKYPRNIKKDLKFLRETKNVDCVFTPVETDIYPEGYASYVELSNDMPKILEGVARPSHFKGVTTVVAKLLNIVKPDRLYLGQKDLQQAVILKKMAADLNYITEVVICPVVREKDGLAMSSRNMYLTPEQRNSAPALYKSLQMAESMIELGERDAQVLVKEIKRKLKDENVEIDYVEVVDPVNLAKKERISGRTAIVAAIYVGKIRLIDNTIINLKDEISGNRE
jgi:pantoate--beta-alanine ligase